MALSILFFCGVVLLVDVGIIYANSITFNGDTAVYIGGRAEFTATSPASSVDIINITWTLNGSPLDQLPDITSNTVMLTGRIRQLVLTNIPITYDNTEVQCTVILDNSADNVSCGPAIQLLVQGRLGAVVNLTSEYDAATSNLNISWSPPAALTVPPATTPERFYCVQVIYGEMMESTGCDDSINEETSYLLNNVMCGVNYTITIIPSNRISNGTGLDLQFPDTPQIMNSSCPEDNGANLTYFYPVSGLVCGCDGEIVDRDVTGVVVCDPNIPEPGILRVTVTATTNKVFNVTTTASNARTMSSSTFESTTFDICDLNLTTANSELDYSVVFVDGSNALGVLMIFLFRTNRETDFSRSIYFVQGRTAAQTTNQLSGVSAGIYETLAYDVEEDGLISSTTAADQENINVTTEQSNGTILLASFGIDINCTSNAINDNRTVMVTCNYNNATYAGFTAYLQNVPDFDLTSATSTDSGSSVFINGSVNGEHFVFVYPIWKPSSNISNKRLEPAYQDTHVLTIQLPTTATTGPDMTSNSSQDTSTSTSSDTAGSATTPTGSPTVGASMGVIVGVTVSVIVVVIFAVIVPIVVVLVCILKKRKHKTVSADINDKSFMMNEKDRQSPSDPEMIAPVYASAHPPPPKIAPDSVKANGDSSAPPTESPPVPTDLYSTVDKTRPQEQMYETVQLQKPSNKKVEDVHMVEYATLQNLDSKPHTESSPEPPPIPARVEDSLSEPGQTYVRQVDCYEVLSGMAADWKVFAENLRVDEDFIDEIYTNNESDVGCLNHFLTSATQNRTKEDMAEALEKMGLMDEAKAVLKLPDRN